MDIKQQALELHSKNKGKIEVCSTITVDGPQALSLAYTPGVAQACTEIHKDPEKIYQYTRKWNLVAVVTDGTAVLGLGDIGPEAGMPVMEGKSILFKQFGGVDAFPICLATKDVDEIVATVKNIAPTFGGINLEDISAPRCFEVERRLKSELDIPVFHDDQHGTAIVALAAIINSLKLVGKNADTCKMVINGAGSAGIAICKLLLAYGIKNITLCDRNGIIHKDCDWLNPAQAELSLVTNFENRTGKLADALVGADLFLGVSAPRMVTSEMVKSMNPDAIVFAMANPEPEIYPDEAKAAGARVAGTGRSDYPNQINNLLAFPGIFRGALDVRAKEINEEMKMAAAKAIASLIQDSELNEENIIPSVFDKRVGPAVAEAVAKAARETGVARV